MVLLVHLVPTFIALQILRKGRSSLSALARRTELETQRMKGKRAKSEGGGYERRRRGLEYGELVRRTVLDILTSFFASFLHARAYFVTINRRFYV